MENLNLLWEYQLADMELEKYEKELKDTPARKKLIKLQRFLHSSQDKISDLEKMAIVKQNAISDLEAQNKALIADLEDLNKDMSYYSECDDDELDQKEVEELVKNSEKTYESIVNIKKQLSKIKQEIELSDKTAKDTLQKMIAAKSEYDMLRVEHNKELESGAGDIDTLKKKLNDAEKNVPEKLLSEYKRIKGFRQNPVAVLSNNRCSGCKMQLPASVALAVANADRPVECENCGRILILM